MAYSEKKRAYNVEYIQKNIKRVPLDVQNDKYKAIKAAADAAGESVNGYIKRAIDERMERDAAIARDKAVAQDMATEYGITVEEVEAAEAFALALDTIDERIPGAREAITSDRFNEFIHTPGGGMPGAGGSEVG